MITDIVIIYKKSGDGGKELRHSLRSLNNVKGEKKVWIVGDTEQWVTNVEYIAFSKRTNSPYADVWAKLTHFVSLDYTPDSFWLSMDDVMIAEKNHILTTLYEGDLPTEGSGIHKRGLVRTREALNALKKPIRNYDIHVPFKVEKKKLVEIFYHVQKTMHGVPIQWRSFYGNYFDIGGEQYEDKKTRDDDLPKGSIISTLRFTPQLEKKFKQRSKYEEGVLIYSNTEPIWQERHRRIKRENGANTYTKEILEYQIPLWRKYFDEAVISTTARFCDISNVHSSKAYIQYLHEYPTDNPLRDVEANIDAGFTDVVYVVSYKELHKAITQAGHKAIWIPMTIDPSSLPEHQPQDSKRIIYYGNVLPPKQETYSKLKDFFTSKGWQFHTISKGYYSEAEGKLTQEQCWDIIKDYKYCIGVGRSYMEMSAIGLKCIVAGHSVGGITKTKPHHEKQVSTNYNTNLFTFSDDLEKIVENIDKVKPRYESIHDNLDFIEKQIKAVLNSDD